MLPTAESSTPPLRTTNQLVLRNTVLLLGAKVLATPISILVNAIIARYLGAKGYSVAYLASTYVGFGLLIVQFGQNGTLPANVAREHERAGEFMGTALSWRLGSSLLVYGALALGCWGLGYDRDFQQVLGLAMAAAVLGSVTTAFLDTIRGFERTDVDALMSVVSPLLACAVTVPILLLGGRLHAILIGEIAIGVVGVVGVSRFLRPTGVGRASFDARILKKLLVQGYPFFFFGLAMTLQPSVDALFLSKLARPEVVGWYAAARKIVGLLLFPAGALIAALYPTLCRLHRSDPAGYARTTSSALRSSILVVIPAAAGCALFPDLGVRIFSERAFGPAEQNLRVLSVFVFLVYFSMPLGSALLAAGRARSWSLVQGGCVVVSLILDPLLVPIFERRMQNGGLGICVASVISELLVVAAGIALMPAGVLSRSIWRDFALGLVAAAAMTATALSLQRFGSFVAAPISVLAYAGCAWLTGLLGADQIQSLRQLLTRKR